MSERLNGASIAAAAPLSTLALSGCSSTAVRNMPKHPEQNQSQWALPLDRYEAQLVVLPTIASGVLVQKCLREKGVDWAASVLPTSAKPGESWNSASRKLFNADLAAKHGYGNSDELDLSSAEFQDLRDGDLANRAIANHDSEIDACFTRAYEELSFDGSSSPWDLANDLAGEAYGASLETTTVRAAAARWRKCLASLGVPDLPESPDLMPPESMNKLTPDIDAPKPFGVLPVKPKEREVAIADAKCRDTTGYSSAASVAEWDEQVTALKKNADALERYDKQMQKINRKAEKVIADYTPSSN